MTSLDWIEIRNIKNPNSREYLIDLDDGEAEVIVLAKEINADLVILDEIMGRRYAKRFEINLTGTIGILLKAKENGLVTSIKKLTSELVEKGTWLNPKLISKALKMANEE